MSIVKEYSNSRNITAEAIAAMRTTTAEHESGYALYLAGKPIVRCDSIAAARGWLEAEWQHDCSMAAEWDTQPTGVHPSKLSDADVEGAIVQADHIAEVEFWEDRRRGF